MGNKHGKITNLNKFIASSIFVMLKQ